VVENEEDVVGPGNDLSSWYADTQPSPVDLAEERAWAIETLSEDWHKLYGTIEHVAENRRALEVEQEKLLGEIAELREELVNQKERSDSLERRLRNGLIFRLARRFGLAD
jgi:chromosome segregation ATPase